MVYPPKDVPALHPATGGSRPKLKHFVHKSQNEGQINAMTVAHTPLAIAQQKGRPA
ncbi:hypothetical protein [Maricaulis sp.]|uniref:hypothetical protein n=1 Tax=Maricaulis sp. TaxID=1486257 RepID=UPI003A953599